MDALEIIVHVVKSMGRYDIVKAFREFIFVCPPGTWIDQLSDPSSVGHQQLASDWRFYIDEKTFPLIEMINKITQYTGAVSESCVKFNLHHRRKLGYIHTDHEYEQCCKFYTMLNYFSSGDQWTTVSNNYMERLRNQGYLIECFGNAFNTRLPYFGSIHPEVDRPWGCLGRFDEILQTLIDGRELIWQHGNQKKIVYKAVSDVGLVQLPPDVAVTCSPPSGLGIQTKVTNMALELLDVGKKRSQHIRVYLCVSEKHTTLNDMIQNSPYCKGRFKVTQAWAMLQGGKSIDMRTRPWYNYTMEN